MIKNNMQKTQTAGGVVIGNNNRILLVSQRNNVWSLPKGHIDPGENELQAAIREIYEESGVKELNLIKKLGEYSRYKIAKNNGDDKSELKTIHIYLFKTSQIKLKPIDPDNPEAIWVEKDKVVDCLTHKKDKEFFLSIINEIK